MNGVIYGKHGRFYCLAAARRENDPSGKVYALKVAAVEANKQRKSKKIKESQAAISLFHERTMYVTWLPDVHGVPRVASSGYGEQDGYRYLVIDMLGSSLESLYQSCTLTWPAVASIAQQLVRCRVKQISTRNPYCEAFRRYRILEIVLLRLRVALTYGETSCPLSFAASHSSHCSQKRLYLLGSQASQYHARPFRNSPRADDLFDRLRLLYAIQAVSRRSRRRQRERDSQLYLNLFSQRRR